MSPTLRSRTAVDVTLGEDENGELYFGGQDGRVLQVQRARKRRLPVGWRSRR